MKKNILLCTNVLICIIIFVGFAITSFINYHFNNNIFEKDVENVSGLTSEGIYYQIESIFTKPINISLTMANDKLLKDFLEKEKTNMNDEAFMGKMQQYLSAYRDKYKYDSVFLVSTETNRYYHFNGLNRVLFPDNAENIWYYDFLNSECEYSLNIDNDEASNNEITVFINCRIKDEKGLTSGVVGVGFRVNYLQLLLKQYEKDFNLEARLVDSKGKVEISTLRTGFENVNIFNESEFSSLRGKILNNTSEIQTFWHTYKNGKKYVVIRYVNNLDWYLMVQNDMSELNKKQNQQIFKTFLIIGIITAIILFTITKLIKNYNKKIIDITTKREKEYYEIRQAATKELYENIYEVDITHNRAVGENAERFFESLGIPIETEYDKAIYIIADKQIHEEFRNDYINKFLPAAVLESYDNGVKTLSLETMITKDGENYHWIRIMACFYFWREDNSLHMIAYYQNIEEEKKQEKKLFEQMQSDSLTGLYNKAVSEELIREKLEASDSKTRYAFMMIDIDDFKRVNDSLGHVAGDFAISEFARILKSQFRSTDIIGRVGGDEFVIFIEFNDDDWIKEKASDLVSILNQKMVIDSKECILSASVGISIYPDSGSDFDTLYKNADKALYKTKKNGKNGYTIYK